MTFLVFEDNGGSYHWTILAADGATLARSEGFASYDDADQAGRRVHKPAASARFQRRANGASPVDLTARRNGASDRFARRDGASDGADAERWLDEGDSFSSKAVTR